VSDVDPSAAPEAPRDASARHRARELAIQWLYQWEIGAIDLDEVFDRERQVELRPPDGPRDRFAEALVRGTAENLTRIDPLIAEHANNWRLERLAVVDRLVLRLATYELLCAPETPPAVVIDEALELARTFSSDAAAPFVNGVLDAIRRTLDARRDEGSTPS
jgi:transcription antitermination protein NusB